MSVLTVGTLRDGTTTVATGKGYTSTGGSGGAPAPAAPAPKDWLGNLTGAKRDAAAALIELFKQYGLESLAGRIVQYVKAGQSSDTITLQLQESPEYKQRFAANEARRKKGLPVLSPAEYISTERAYRQVMTAAGLPTGFYDTNSDFQQFLEQDVSPTEVQGRVQLAQDAMYSADPATLDYFRQHYSEGEITAFFLDSTKALPLIERNYRAAKIGGAAQRNGVDLAGGLADQLATAGVTDAQAAQAFGTIGQSMPNLNKLGAIYGDSFTVEDATKAALLNDAGALSKQRKLASQERAAFNGQGGAAKGLGSQGGGQV